ncbi:MAG: HEAT repeat domain-containing protein [Planctomycetota bacterium]
MQRTALATIAAAAAIAATLYVSLREPETAPDRELPQEAAPEPKAPTPPAERVKAPSPVLAQNPAIPKPKPVETPSEEIDHGPVPLMRHIRALESGKEVERVRAVQALRDLAGTAGEVVAVPALVSALQDDSKQVRSAAAHALGEIGPKAADHAVTPLVGQLKDRVMTPVILQSFGKMGPSARKAAPAILEILANSEQRSSVRRAALDAVLKIRGRDAEIDGHLEKLQNDPNERLARSARRILEGIDSVEPVERN